MNSHLKCIINVKDGPSLMNTFDLIHSSLKIQNIILQLRKLLTKPSNRTFGSEIIYFYSIINIIWQL